MYILQLHNSPEPMIGVYHLSQLFWMFLSCTDKLASTYTNDLTFYEQDMYFEMKIWPENTVVICIFFLQSSIVYGCVTTSCEFYLGAVPAGTAPFPIRWVTCRCVCTTCALNVDLSTVAENLVFTSIYLIPVFMVFMLSLVTSSCRPPVWWMKSNLPKVVKTNEIVRSVIIM